MTLTEKTGGQKKYRNNQKNAQTNPPIEPEQHSKRTEQFQK